MEFCNKVPGHALFVYEESSPLNAAAYDKINIAVSLFLKCLKHSPKKKSFINCLLSKEEKKGKENHFHARKCMLGQFMEMNQQQAKANQKQKTKIKTN